MTEDKKPFFSQDELSGAGYFHEIELSKKAIKDIVLKVAGKDGLENIEHIGTLLTFTAQIKRRDGVYSIWFKPTQQRHCELLNPKTKKSKKLKTINQCGINQNQTESIMKGKP